MRMESWGPKPSLHSIPDGGYGCKVVNRQWFKFLCLSTGPLDRGCQQLIIPACKNLGVSNHTLVTVEQQKQWYRYTYKMEPSADLEPDFPPEFLEMLQRYPKCQQNLKKMICGEFFPPCFPDEGYGYYSICRSVCDDIARDCPEFFRYWLSHQEWAEKAIKIT